MNQPIETRFLKLVNTVKVLRGPDGCPWDREQTVQDIRRYLLEECHELLDAITAGAHHEICEESGDLLLQIIFLALLHEEQNLYTLSDVISGITGKMISRHPHVFSDTRVSGVEEVLKNWEEIKSREKHKETRRSMLDGIPQSLPALAKAEVLQKKAARVGFDWPDSASTFEKVKEEILELEHEARTGNRDAEQQEFGDLLFSLVNYARKRGIDPDAALAATNAKFTRRFQYLEENKPGDWESMTLQEMDALWNEAKSL